MAKFQFPQNPGTNRPNPFQDAAGQNPFGDPGSKVPDTPSSESGASAYQVRQPGEERFYQPGDYQAILSPRGRTVLTLGLTAFVLEVIGAIAEVMGVFSMNELLAGIIVALPLQLLGLAFGIPACIFGRNDLRAMAAGAMRPGGERPTRIGFRLAIVGVILGGLFVTLYVVLLILDAIGIDINLGF